MTGGHTEILRVASLLKSFIKMAKWQITYNKGNNEKQENILTYYYRACLRNKVILVYIYLF